MPLFNNLGILTGSIYLYKDGEALASGSKLTISPDFTTTGKYDFIYETSGSTSVKLLTLSSSGQDPRVGIGNENPQTTLDIKEIKDDTVGAEILIRSSRTTKGGEVGDGAGKILFVIDSGSYTDVKSSGSIATITTEVKAINDKMAGGDLIFKVSDTELSDPDPATVLRFSRNTGITGFTNNFATMSAALHVEDNITSTRGITGDNLSSNATITATSYIYSADSIRVGSNTAPTTKGLYVSGNITSSNDLSIRGFPSVSASLASLASGVGTLQQVTDAGNTTSNPISSSFNGVGFFGTASWAINVVNGGGGGGGGSDSAFLDQSTAATTWSFAHNLGTQYPVITVYDTTGQVIIPQEIDGEDTNNLKIYFPTSQSGYATAVGGTSALTYYSQSLITASVNLNTITFTKGNSSTFNITVNTGSVPTLQQVTTQGANTTTPITASIISASSFTGSLFGTASWATNALTASLAPGYLLVSQTSSFVQNSQTSSFVQNSQTSSFVLNSQTSSMTVLSSSFTLTSSLANRNILTASVSSNTITFTKGDGTTFPITVNTGSGGGGSVGTLQQVTEQGASTIVPITASIVSASSFTGSLFGTSSWALNVVGGGSGVTINNNVDNYIITATGTSNTLNGESELLYSGSTLINRGRTYFGSGSAPNSTSHAFRGYNLGDSSYFSVLDFEGFRVFNIGGDAISGSLYIDLGDTVGAYNSTNIVLDDNLGNINLTGKSISIGDPTNNSYLQYTEVDSRFNFKGNVESSFGGFTGSLQGTASLASRNILTASVNSNTITFTKGDNTTFNLTINTGSGGGGGTPGGANTTIQFNDSNTFSGSGNFTFNKTTNVVTLTGSLNISSSGTALQIRGTTGSVLLSVSGSVPNIFSISNSGSARLATFTQTTNNHGILLVGSESYQPTVGSSATDGVLILLGVNRSGNRQLWIGDSTAAGSATNGFFRYQTGTPLPSLDATSGNGLNRLNVNIGTATTNAGVGYEYNGATGTTLPPSRLSVNGGLTVASGSSFTASTAPVGGVIIQGNTLIGTTTNSTFRLDVSGAVRLRTGLSVTGSTVLSGSISTIGTTSMTGSLVVSTNITASRTFLSGSVGTISGSTLTVYGSGSAQPVFTVQGSSGELFSVTDSLTGSLFSVNDISGLPVLEVFSDNSVLIGSYLDPMLISTAKVTQTNSGSFTVYSLPTASYDTAFFEYSVRSGSNARVGTIMAIQSASSVNFTETTASQFGNTSAISFTVIITGSNMALTGSSTTGSWTIKTIVRGI